jgi:hypothetical protein
MYNKFMPKDIKQNATSEPISNPAGNPATGAKKPNFKKFEDGKSKLPFPPVVFGVAFAGILALVLVYLFGFSDTKGILRPTGNTPVGEDKEILLQNPLTGVMYKKNEAGPINERPLAVMVNNHIDARPQSGLVDADLVYEIVAEGGITRLIPFYLSKSPTKIGPVRSTREYYLVLVKELGDAMIMHIGWSPQALEAIQTWPVRSLGRGGAEFWRDNPRNVAIEHTAYVDGEYLRKLGLELGWEGRRDFTVWKFKDDAPVIGLPVGGIRYATDITIDFWYEGDYSTVFKYDSTNNSYLRFNGYDSAGAPIPTKDQETQKQVNVKTVIVQFAKETSIEGDEKNRLDYELVGSGTGLVFMDGTVHEVTWSKADRDERTMFYNQEGEEMEFNRGKFWICVVPTRNASQVQY